MERLKPLPQSWSDLTWQQLTLVWDAKIRYGGNPDVAICAALLALLGCRPCRNRTATPDPHTAEPTYTIEDPQGNRWTVTPRALAHLAHTALPWFPFPYGDPGEKEERDEKGKVVKERREAVRGLVNRNYDQRDAMSLNVETLTVEGHTFALPQVACHNLTWHQYRTLQSLVPAIFQEGITDEQALDLQAQFVAYSTVPELEEEEPPKGKKDPFRPQHNFRYIAERAEATIPFWRKQLEAGSPIYYICFQVYQTAIQNFYSTVYYDLFHGTSRNDPLHTALTGEGDTLTAIMKEGNYTDPQQVYETNLPIVLAILNRMTKQAKELEKIKTRKK